MTTPLTPEILVTRLGESLVQSGIISEADLQRALAYQQQKREQGHPCFLGQALVELGLIDRQQLDHAVTMQILQLRNALEEANRSLERRVQERTAELQEALRKLSELNQLKANFVSNISHELRTPLTHIKGYLELLASGALGELNEEQKHAVQVSQRSAAQLESLIDNLILFAQASRGEMALRLQSVDLTKIAAEVLRYSRVKASNRNITLEHHLPPDLPLVQADAEKLSWALLQLLDNAIKFTPAGGKITLSMEVEAGQLVIISVKDTGIGIPAHRIQEIFEPFHQLDGSSTRRYGGTGLGLALVREIIQAHGSFLEVESTEGVGSEFRFPLVVSRPVSLEGQR